MMRLPSSSVPFRPRRFLGQLAFFALVCWGPAAPAGAQATPAPCVADAAPACLRRGLELADATLRTHPDGAAGGRLRDALALLDSACVQGLGDGCYFAGRILPTILPDAATDTAIQATHTQSLRRFVAGCRARRPSGDACNGAGYAFMFALGTQVMEDSALAYYALGCELGNATACYREGLRLETRPELGPHALDAAVARYRVACRLGSPGGCGNVAYHTERRLKAVPQERRGSAEFRRGVDSVRAGYRVACAGGQLWGCTNLGGLFDEDGLGPDADPDSARWYYWKGCMGLGEDTTSATPLGNGYGCYRLGQLALAAHDSARARRLTTAGCQLFDDETCVSLGRMKHEAQSSPEHYANLFLFAAACGSRSGWGCLHVGYAFEHDKLLVDADRTDRAREYYLRACAMDSGDACNYLALLRLGPLSTLSSPSPEEVRDAIKFYRRGCALGSAGACEHLATLMANRFGDVDRAQNLYESACQNGSARGCWQMMLAAQRIEDPVGEGTYRSSACRLDPQYCKKKS